MNDFMKVVLAAGIGSAIAAVAEPHVTGASWFPESLKGETAGKVVHGAITGLAAGAAYLLVRKA